MSKREIFSKGHFVAGQKLVLCYFSTAEFTVWTLKLKHAEIFSHKTRIHVKTNKQEALFTPQGAPK